jgi:hypothetical protein
MCPKGRQCGGPFGVRPPDQGRWSRSLRRCPRLPSQRSASTRSAERPKDTSPDPGLARTQPSAAHAGVSVIRLVRSGHISARAVVRARASCVTHLKPLCVLRARCAEAIVHSRSVCIMAGNPQRFQRERRFLSAQRILQHQGVHHYVGSLQRLESSTHSLLGVQKQQPHEPAARLGGFRPGTLLPDPLLSARKVRNVMETVSPLQHERNSVFDGHIADGQTRDNRSATSVQGRVYHRVTGMMERLPFAWAIPREAGPERYRVMYKTRRLRFI